MIVSSLHIKATITTFLGLSAARRHLAKGETIGLHRIDATVGTHLRRMPNTDASAPWQGLRPCLEHGFKSG